MRTLFLVLVLAPPALADDLLVRVELIGGAGRDVLSYEHTSAGIRVRSGSADGGAEPERWVEVKCDETAAGAFEALLAKENAWSLVSDAAEAARGEKLTVWAPACGILLESAGGKRVRVTKRPFVATEDTAWGRIARALLAIARPAPAGTGIEFSFTTPITDVGYTLSMSTGGPKPRVQMRPHHPDGTLDAGSGMDVSAEDFEAAWRDIEAENPWAMGDAEAADGPGDRVSVRLWKDGVEHRFRLVNPQALGPQPHKKLTASVLAVKGVKALRDLVMQTFRENQLRTRVARLYQDWARGDETTRADAERALMEIGESTLPILRELVDAETKGDIKTRGNALIDRIARKK